MHKPWFAVLSMTALTAVSLQPTRSWQLAQVHSTSISANSWCATGHRITFTSQVGVHSQVEIREREIRVNMAGLCDNLQVGDICLCTQSCNITLHYTHALIECPLSQECT